MYIEKDVADNIDSEIIISHRFQNIKTCEKNFKTLCICLCFYFVMLIYTSFIIINFFNLVVLNDHPKKNF